MKRARMGGPPPGLWWASFSFFLLVGWAPPRPVRACPEPCACVDKYAQQFADCAYKDLASVPSGLPSNVTTLSLSANKIAALGRASFVGVTQVTSLWLAHNRIAAIEEGTLAILGQLKNLDVSHNLIVDFPWADLGNLSALQLLKMNNNRMAYLPGGAFRALRDLRSLRINNNRFAAVAEGTFEPLASLSHLQIYHNPFNCTCQLMWLKNWTLSTAISIPEQEAIACAEPEPWRGLPLAKLPDLRCAAPEVALDYLPGREPARLAYGAALALRCQVSGSPPPELRWRIQTASGQSLELRPGEAAPGEGARNRSRSSSNSLPSEDDGGPPTGRFRAFANGTLEVAHLSKREEGTYTCLATNEVGSRQRSLRLALPDDAPKEPPSRPGAERKAQGKASKNSVLKAEEGRGVAKAGVSMAGAPFPSPAWPSGGALRNASGPPGSPLPPPPGSELVGGCGPPGREGPPRLVSNQAFAPDDPPLKPRAVLAPLGVLALDVSEREARVQITPLAPHEQEGPGGPGLGGRLFLCEEGASSGGRPALVQWARVSGGRNAYWFRGLRPATNYSLCLGGAVGGCRLEVAFRTKSELPSLGIVVGVGAALLALATLPLLGAACCHLMAKYPPGQPYKLILRARGAQPPADQKRMAADFDPRASYLGDGQPCEVGHQEEEEEEEEEEGGGGSPARGETPAPSSPGDPQAKAPPKEDSEGGSEDSDPLPLGAEALSILLAHEINGNYRPPPTPP